MSTYGRYQTSQLQNAVGQALAGVEVYFLTQPANVQSLTPLATVYANATGAGGPVTQPLFTDGLGQFSAYLSPGVYTVVYVISTAGTFSYPDQNIAIGGGTPGTVTFDGIGSGTNTSAAMVVGSGSSLVPSGSGIIAATKIGGVTVTGAPGTGQVLTATSPTAADWQNSGGSSSITSVNSQTGPALTIAVGAGLAITSIGNVITISLGTTFAITSFTGGWTVPVGASVVNPTFAATYTTTPASADIINTEGISSPTNLTSPFTSGAITGTFVHTTPETTTFTLSATQGSTVTATQTGNWGYEIFGGYGAAGATSTVTASGTTAVLSNSTVLPRLQIGSETIGESLGPFTGLTGQNIYLLLTGGSHTFTSAGLPAAFNAPLTVSFVNSNGASVTMYLYQSTNALYGNYTIVVAS